MLTSSGVSISHAQIVASSVQGEETAANLALSTAKRIDENKLFLPLEAQSSGTADTESVDNTPLWKLRKNLHNSFFQLNNENYSDLLERYNFRVRNLNSQHDKNLSKLFNALAPISGTNDVEEAFDDALRILEPYTESLDWFVAATAWHFISYINTIEGDFNGALQNANNALSIVPDEISSVSTEIRIELTENLSFLHGRLRNPLLTVVNASRVIDLQIAAGRPVDGALHLNNMIYVFSHWRDHKTTQVLAEILLKNEDTTNSSTPGLTYMRLAKNQNEVLNFQEGLNFADAGLKVANHLSVIDGLVAMRVVSLAGIGNVEAARSEMTVFRAAQLSNSNKSASIEEALTYAEALIAFAEGDIKLGQRLITERMDKYIQSTLRRSNEASAELIATLENSKSRQIERQSALQREAVLREAELQQKTVTNSLLIILTSFMAVAAVLSGLFGRYRSKTAVRLRIARDQAKAGEKSKSEFLAIMSHELRTPLNGIIGIADLLSQQAPSEDLKRKNAIILNSGNELLSLVESILDMSRIEAQEMNITTETVEIRALIQTVEHHWREIIEARKIIFTCFIDESVPDQFETDPERFTQCLNNLISNASKFTKSGRIHLHLTSMPAETKGEMILTAIIADTGSGIREEVIERLFQPFVQADASITRKFGGAGLGLAITRSLARLMGGDLTVVSRAGRGSEFTLTLQGAFKQTLEKTTSSASTATLPLPSEIIPRLTVETPNSAETVMPANETRTEPVISLVPVARQVPAEDQAPRLLSGLRILIVEDVVSNQDIIQIFLKPLGCQFVTAKNGVEALRALETHDVDLILMDIRMPEMDGIEATRRIRETRSAYQHIPIVALTADKTDDMHQACLAAGIDLFLTKPVIAKDLISSIRFVIEHPNKAQPEDTGPDLQEDRPRSVARG